LQRKSALAMQAYDSLHYLYGLSESWAAAHQHAAKIETPCRSADRVPGELYPRLLDMIERCPQRCNRMKSSYYKPAPLAPVSTTTGANELKGCRMCLISLFQAAPNICGRCLECQFQAVWIIDCISC
jgi:hypothetical protein